MTPPVVKLNRILTLCLKFVNLESMTNRVRSFLAPGLYVTEFNVVQNKKYIDSNPNPYLNPSRHKNDLTIFYQKFYFQSRMGPLQTVDLLFLIFTILFFLYFSVVCK